MTIESSVEDFRDVETPEDRLVFWRENFYKDIESEISDGKLSKMIAEDLGITLPEVAFLKKVRDINAKIGVVEASYNEVSEILGGEGPWTSAQRVNRSTAEALSSIEEIIKKLFRFDSEEASKWLKDKMTDIYNIEYFNSRMTLLLDEMIGESAKGKEGQSLEDKMKSMVTIYFDLDGLKSINDNIGHNAGDKAIHFLAEAMNNSKLKQWAVEKGIELIPTHKSGDEFVLGIVSGERDSLIDAPSEGFKGVEDVNDKSIAQYIGEYITNKLNSEENGKEIIDFSNEGGKFKGIVLPNGIELKNVNFKLNASFGVASMINVWKKVGEESEDEQGDYGNFLYKILIGGMVDEADQNLNINKEEGKRVRRKSEDINERALETLYRFTDRSDSDASVSIEEEIAKLSSVELLRVISEVYIKKFKKTLIKLQERLVKIEHSE